MLLSPLGGGGRRAGPLLGRGALSRPGAGSFGGINQVPRSVGSKHFLKPGYSSSFSAALVLHWCHSSAVKTFTAHGSSRDLNRNSENIDLIHFMNCLVGKNKNYHHSREMLDKEP